MEQDKRDSVEVKGNSLDNDLSLTSEQVNIKGPKQMSHQLMTLKSNTSNSAHTSGTTNKLNTSLCTIYIVTNIYFTYSSYIKLIYYM